MQAIKFISLLFIISLLCQCSTPPKPIPSSIQKNGNTNHFQIRQQHFLKQTTWHAKGRIAANNSHDGGSANFDWQNINLKYSIKLSGPLGLGSAKLNGQPDQVTFIDQYGKRHTATNPETLMKKLLGWQVPIQGLNYWIKGILIPNINYSNLTLDELGRLNTVEQSGWTIQYVNYYEATLLSLPKKITLTNNDLKVKLVIKQWQV